MIVEFMGCTGAGKTTLALGVARHLRACGYDVHDQTVSGGSGWQTALNLARAARSLVPVLAEDRYRRLLVALWRATNGRRPAAPWLVTRLLGAVRVLGEDAQRRRLNGRAVIILDEGPLGLLHAAFCSPRPVTPAALLPLSGSLILPDLIVWVDAPLPALIERTHERNDPPRELRGHAEDWIASCLANVQASFATLTQAPSVEERLIKAWNPPMNPREREMEVERVAQAIIARDAPWPA